MVFSLLFFLMDMVQWYFISLPPPQRLNNLW